MASLVYHVGVTTDGFIAHVDHTVDGFLFEGEHVTDYLASLRDYGVVLMGRRTYEFGLRLGVSNPYPTMRQLVFSTSMTTSPDPAVEVVAGDPVPFVAALKATSARPIWLCGGATLAGALFAAGLVDELIVKHYPVLFGAGIPLLGRAIPTCALTLRTSTCYPNGVQRLHYDVAAARDQKRSDADTTAPREDGTTATSAGG